MEITHVMIENHFSGLTPLQISQFAQLQELYTYWNSQINVISRKDIEHLTERHVLHSLAIAKLTSFMPGTCILDVGTGGGFPGIPLAIMFPEVQFMLADSIGKKIKVVNEVASALKLENVTGVHQRAESIPQKFDFVISRAVTEFSVFYNWIKNSFRVQQIDNPMNNGILYLKGGDFQSEVAPFGQRAHIYNISDWLSEPFFETKKIIYVRMVQSSGKLYGR